MAFPSLKIECFHEMWSKFSRKGEKLYACNRTDMKAAEEFISPTKNGRGLDKLEKKCCQNIDWYWTECRPYVRDRIIWMNFRLDQKPG